MTRTILITGASDGLGAAAARQLAERGHRVLVAGRSPEKTAAVARSVGAEPLVADFARLDDVRRLAEEVRQRLDGRLDVLASNAGGIFGKRSVTDDGFELTFQVNHLAPFLLTHLLLPELRTAGGSVVATSSAANRLFGRLDLDDLQLERRYSPSRAYGAAKLANILFVRGIEQRYGSLPAGDGALRPEGSEARAVHGVAFHPGVVSTSFASGSSSLLRVVYRTPLRRLMTTDEQAGATLAWLAEGTAGTDWHPGGYYDKRSLSRPNRQADDPELVDGLWRRSAAMVGVDAD